MLSNLQKKKIKRLFNVFDGDGDGYLEASDADRIAKRIAAIRNWSEESGEYQKLLKLYQEGIAHIRPYADDQGRADLEAYYKFHDKILNIPGGYRIVVAQLANFLFEVLDADGDGMISLEEVRQFFQAYSIAEEHAPTTFAKMDVDEDGHLSKAEIKDAVAQFYFSSDPDARGNWMLGPLDD